MLSSSKAVSGLYSGNKYQDILWLFNTFRDYTICVNLRTTCLKDRQKVVKKKKENISEKLGENLMKGKKPSSSKCNRNNRKTDHQQF